MAASVLPGNGFQRFGIKHLSASSINLFKNAPDVWVMQYLLKKRTSGSPAMTRGIAAEDGVVAALASELDFDDALAIAHKRFDRSYPLALDPKVSKERSDIDGYMKQAILALCEYDKPDFSKGTMDNPYPQEKILIKSQLVDGSVIDIIGYLDLVYPQHGLVIDRPRPCHRKCQTNTSCKLRSIQRRRATARSNSFTLVQRNLPCWKTTMSLGR